MISDDVYQLLVWPDRSGAPDRGSPRPLRWHAREIGHPGTVVSLGTFSKLMGPGLRLGWVEAEVDLVAGLDKRGVITSGGGLNPLVDVLLTAALKSGDVERFRTEVTTIVIGLAA